MMVFSIDGPVQMLMAQIFLKYLNLLIEFRHRHTGHGFCLSAVTSTCTQLY